MARRKLSIVWTLSLTVLLLLMGAVPVAMYYAHQHTLRRLGLALGAGLGLPVAIDNVWGAPLPSAVFEGVRLGGDRGRPVATIRRVEVELNLGRLAQLAFQGGAPQGPVVRRVRILSPRLTLSLKQLRRWLQQPAGRAGAAPRPARGVQLAGGRGLGALGEVLVEGGTVLLELPSVGGRKLHLLCRDVFLRPHGRGHRLLLGHTTITMDGHPLVDLSAVSADLQPHGGGVRLARLAAVGGKLRLKSASAQIHVWRVRPAPSGYEVRVQGELGGEPKGKIDLLAQLGRDLSLQQLRVTLKEADLGPLQTLLIPYGIRARGTRASGSLTVGWDGLEHWVGLKLAAREMVLRHKLLARRAVGPVEARLEGQLALDRQQRQITIHALRLTSGAVTLDLGGTVALQRGRLRTDVSLRMERTPCHQVLASLPTGFAPTLSGLVLAGEMAVKIGLKLDSADLERTVVDVDLKSLACKVVHDPPAADVNSLRAPVTITSRNADGSARQLVLGPNNADYRPLYSISRHVRAAFKAAEDSRFNRHDGFDRELLRRAFVYNLRQGRLVKGASTISQQVIKNIFLSHQRTISRKFQEAVLTWRMEQRLTKKRILELYLNLVEMGPGIYGVSRASRVYFDKEPGKLTPLEAVHLAALTPSPRYLATRHQGGRPSVAWMRRLHVILRLMRYNGNLTREEQKKWEEQRLKLIPLARP